MLDLTLSIENHKILVIWFQKSICLGNFLNFASHCPIHNKCGVLFDLVDRAIKLLRVKFHKENLNIFNTLLKIVYPSELLNFEIAEHYKTITESKHKNNLNEHSLTETKIIVMPYINGFDETLFRIFNRKTYIQVACILLKTLSIKFFLKILKT